MKWFHLFMMKPLSKLLGFLFSKNGATFSIGMAVHFLLNFLVNGLLAGYAVLHLPLLQSMALLYWANIIKVILMVKIYDHIGKDIFGIEASKTHGAKNRIVKRFEKLLQSLEGRGQIFVHAVLIIVDHFFGLIYIRKELHVHRGIPKRDLFVLFGAMVPSTLIIIFGWEILIKIYWVLHSLYVQIGPKGTLVVSLFVLILIFLIKRFKKHRFNP